MADLDQLVDDLHKAHATAKEALGLADPITMALHDVITEAMQVRLNRTASEFVSMTQVALNTILNGTETTHDAQS